MQMGLERLSECVGQNLTVRRPGGFREAFQTNRRPLNAFNY